MPLSRPRPLDPKIGIDSQAVAAPSAGSPWRRPLSIRERCPLQLWQGRLSKLGTHSRFWLEFAASRIAPEPRWKRFASASTPAAPLPISCRGAGARPAPLPQGADAHRRSGQRHPRRHRRTPRPDRSRPRRCQVAGARHDAGDQRRARRQVGTHRADHDAGLSRCSRARAAAPAALFQSRYPEADAAGAARLPVRSREGRIAARRQRSRAAVGRRRRECGRCAEGKAGRGGGGLLSCTPTRIRRTKSAPRALVQKLWPDIYLCTSNDVLAEFREFERFATATVNASLMPVMDRYLERFESGRAPISASAARRVSCSRMAAPCRPVRCAGCR